jgi:phage tail-like protein
MQRFMAEVKKRDPYRNFNFRISLQGVEVAACRKMSGLTGTVDVVKFRAGSNQHSNEELSPGRVHYEPVTLESGLSTHPAFEAWATQLIRHESTPGLRSTDPDFRREVEIYVYDIDYNLDAPVKKFILHKAWVSKYTAMSELAAEANEVLIETIEIQHEGFTRVDAG